MRREQKYRITIIEDNAPDAYLLQYILENQGLKCDVVEIDNGGDALDFVNRAGNFSDSPIPDLVVLDLNLPKIDGHMLLEQMRARPAFAGVPIVVWTSSQSPQDRSQVESCGVAFVSKPIGLDAFAEVGDLVGGLLKRRVIDVQGLEEGDDERAGADTPQTPRPVN